jgi:hypothetical protein
MSGETEIVNVIPPAPSLHDVVDDESLTDVIDQIKRRAFLRALERRPGADVYRRTIDTSQLVRVKSS